MLYAYLREGEGNKHYTVCLKKSGKNGIKNVTVWPVLRNLSHLEAYKLFIGQVDG
jgi:hypothetical protein